MERQRPDYLPPLKPRRRSFPWLLFIAAVLLALAAFGIKQHIDTQIAWNARFERAGNARISPATPALPVDVSADDPVEYLRDVQNARQRAEQDARERASWRCIDGIPFRKIPGGWENVPGERC